MRIYYGLKVEAFPELIGTELRQLKEGLLQYLDVQGS